MKGDRKMEYAHFPCRGYRTSVHARRRRDHTGYRGHSGILRT